jgi:glyoxylase-like metal-dependent hydrolase (beta-lactamase superfamily II)
MAAADEQSSAIVRIRAGETNCYLVRAAVGTILVDPGPPGSAPAIAAGAAAAGVEPGQIRLILVTHGHLDHFGAAGAVQAWCGAPVAVHPLAPELSRDRRNALPPAQTMRGSLVRWAFLLLAPLFPFAPLDANILLEEDADLSIYGPEGRTILLPGHAPGSLGILTAQGDALVGDLLVNYVVPSKPLYMADGEAWQHSYERLRSLQPRRVFVGHGEPFAGEGLARVYSSRYQFRWWVR